MKPVLCLIISIFAIVVSGCASASTNGAAGFRLTVELRDGSRVIGKSGEDQFAFRSPILGDLNLPLEKVRLVERLSGTNLVKLTTSGADSLTVAFAMKDIAVQTTYGHMRLPVDLVKSVRVTVLGKPGRTLDGLVGLWSGEGNGTDSVGHNDGTLQNVSFTKGVVGQAFSFAPNSFPWGTYTGVQIPDRPEFVLTQAFTIEAWVRPRGDGYIILCRGDHRPGMDPYTLSMQANHDLRFQICGQANDTVFVDANLPYCQWTHVAAVFDGDNHTISLYTNGVLAAQSETHIQPIGELIPQLSPGLGIGNLSDGGNNFPFVGDIDEISLYNRALSVDEVNAIYEENATNAGGSVELLPTRSHGPFGMPVPIRSHFSGYNSD